MSVFEVAFNLVGLVLGLSLVEVLSGLAKVLRKIGRIRVGWLCPLLGIWVIGDVTTFWGQAWEARNLMSSVWQALGVGVTFSSAYYLAASQVFPPEGEECLDLDDWYWRTKRVVLGVILGCNLATWAISLALGRVWGPTVTVINAAYAIVLVAALLLPGRRTNILLLLTQIGILAWSFAVP
jgi:hypothetical protein